jgi:hypothetical protein
MPRFVITVTELSAFGKSAVAAILSFGALLQVPAVSAPIMQFGHYHPHFAGAIATVTMLSTLLAIPQVQTILHIPAKAASQEPK